MVFLIFPFLLPFAASSSPSHLFSSSSSPSFASVQMLIFVYDEVRKYLMRTTSPEVMDKATGQVRRVAGWLERNTYY